MPNPTDHPQPSTRPAAAWLGTLLLTALLLLVTACGQTASSAANGESADPAPAGAEEDAPAADEATASAAGGDHFEISGNRSFTENDARVYLRNLADTPAAPEGVDGWVLVVKENDGGFNLVQVEFILLKEDLVSGSHALHDIRIEPQAGQIQAQVKLPKEDEKSVLPSALYIESVEGTLDLEVSGDRVSGSFDFTAHFDTDTGPEVRARGAFSEVKIPQS
ncbi:MAG: hypothetical protein SX243_07900 [Acidobacteriota bacterium]|nr:hypothetical protein [Acidobacteriota bacterium]